MNAEIGEQVMRCRGLHGLASAAALRQINPETHEEATMKRYIAAVAMLVLCSCWAAAKKRPTDPASGSCTAYFVVVEQDDNTVNIQMAGFNTPQEKWYEKHGGEFPALCVAATASGRREALDEGTLINHLEGDIPVYIILWEEHIMYNSSGTRYYSASGVLS